MLKTIHILILMKKLIKKNPKFKVGDHVRISKNTKIFLLKAILQIGQREYLLLKKLKIQFHGLLLLTI